MQASRKKDMKASPNIYGALYSVFFATMSPLWGECFHAVAYFTTAIAWAISAVRVQEQPKLLPLTWLVIGGGLAGIISAAVAAQYELTRLFVGNLHPAEAFLYSFGYIVAGIGHPLISLAQYPVPSVSEFVKRKDVRASIWVHAIIALYSFIFLYSISVLLLYWFAR